MLSVIGPPELNSCCYQTVCETACLQWTAFNSLSQNRGKYGKLHVIIVIITDLMVLDMISCTLPRVIRWTNKQTVTVKTSKQSSYSSKFEYRSQMYIIFSGGLKASSLSHFDYLRSLGTSSERSASLHSQDIGTLQLNELNPTPKKIRSSSVQLSSSL